MSVPQSQIDYDRAHAAAYNATGFLAFCIAGISIITVSTLLRLWSRKIQKQEWQSDDYTLIVALILTIASVICYIIMDTHYGTGRHFYSLSETTQVHFLKAQYAFNILYTVGYPLSRISLVLLYTRIFVQEWYRVICWFFVCVYAGYAISTALADVWLTIPIEAYWDMNITPTHKVNEDKLYLANAFFNIVTDCIMLVLPLTVVWRLHMEIWQKIALSGIFALGTLTMIASIVRLTLFFKVDGSDPTYNFTVSSFWTVAELCLGILCPCLVTFRPLIRPALRFFPSRFSYGKSPKQEANATHRTIGSEPMHRRDYKDFHRYLENGASASDDTDLEQQSVSKLVEYQPAEEVPKRNLLPFTGKVTRTSSPPPLFNSMSTHSGDHRSTNNQLPAAPVAVAQKPPTWRSNVGLAQMPNSHDAIALASLDPRAHATASGHPQIPSGDDETDYYATFGTTTEAKAVPSSNEPPQAGHNDRGHEIYPIEVQREFKLERE